MTAQHITMLPMKGLPDAELALSLVMDALREKANGPRVFARAPRRPGPARCDAIGSQQAAPEAQE